MGDGRGHGKGKGTKGKSKSKCSPEEIRHAAQLNAWRDSEDLPRKSPGSCHTCQSPVCSVNAQRILELQLVERDEFPLPSQPGAGTVRFSLEKVRSQRKFRCIKGGVMTSSKALLVDNEVSFSLGLTHVLHMGVTKRW